MKSNLVTAMERYLSDQLEKIKQMSLSEIIQLPEYSSKDIKIDKKRFTLATWKKQRTDGIIQIVVQAYYHKFLGIGIMQAEGFFVDSQGNFLPLPEEIRLEYR